jgi:hypothetical protein
MLRRFQTPLFLTDGWGQPSLPVEWTGAYHVIRIVE